MKVTICFLVVVLVVSLDAQPVHVSRTKRGFRAGAADRFSHGFGKRTNLDIENYNNESGKMMTNEEMTELLEMNPRLISAFVEKYMDKNEDGYISRQELFPTLPLE